MRDVLKLGLRLLLFTLIAGLLLSLTNRLTEAPIARRREQVANSSRHAVLPEADVFEPVEGVDWAAYPAVAEVMRAVAADGTDAGFAFSLAPMGYKGPIYMTLGVNARGAVTNLVVNSQSETAGLGTKITQGAFLNQFTGIAAAPQAMDSAVDTISGATVSSSAVNNGVRQALKLAGTLGVAPASDPSLKELSPLMPEDMALLHALPDMTGLSELVPYALMGDYPDIKRVRRAALAGGESAYIFDATPKGFGGTIDMQVVIDAVGEIASVRVLSHQETADRAAETVGSPAFLDRFVGMPADSAALGGVDAVSGATLSSNAVKQAVSQAARFYQAYLTPTRQEGGAAQ